MNRHRTLISMLSLLWILAQLQHSAQQVPAASLPPSAKTQIVFERDIEPLLRERCHSCHGAERQLGGLRLDNRASALAGGYSGPVITPGSSAESKLIHLVAGLREGLVMPMSGERLTPQQLGLLRAWIDQGVSWPNRAPRPEGRGSRTSKSSHWAFLPPRRPAIPETKNTAWVRSPIDAFVLARLEREGIQPSPEADSATSIRRLRLDLTGLPPTPAEVVEFLADKRPDAYQRLVDRLLASPHYGEKWARQWLDLAHYADSDGYEKDNLRPHAWKWRQWTIEALNRNMPFDQFTIEQIAGDSLPNATVEQKAATGFFRNTLTNREGGVDKEEYRVEQVVDRTATLGAVWLGLTVGCARCHDHKYDPITQRDFYQLFAFFNTAIERNIEDPLPDELGVFLQRRMEYDSKKKALLAEFKVRELQEGWEKLALEAAAHPGVDPVMDAVWKNLGLLFDGCQETMTLNPSQRTRKQQDVLTDAFVFFFRQSFGKQKHEARRMGDFSARWTKLREEYPGLTEVQTLAENPDPPRTHILIRGDFRQPGLEVQPNTPAFLGPPPDDPKLTRLSLARWLVSKDNPLTARIWVNRHWQELFGSGLVVTSADFGMRTESPSHPDLLDWLATEFIDTGWNMKKIHKMIVESATYRQSSTARADLRPPDPYNRLLARQSRLRLSAESIRDVVLAASGLLNRNIGGRSVCPPQPPGVSDLAFGFGPAKWTESTGSDRYRRGLYIRFLRTAPYPQLVTFDAPDSMVSCSRRDRSTTPLQALNLMNDPVFFEAAQVLAARILREERGSLARRIDYAFLLCLAREPRPPERDEVMRHYRRLTEILQNSPELVETLFPAKDLQDIDPAEAAVWVGVSRLLLNLEELITRS